MRPEKPESWHRYWRKGLIMIGALMAFVVVGPILAYEAGIKFSEPFSTVVIILIFVLGFVWMYPDLKEYRNWRDEQKHQSVNRENLEPKSS